MNRFLALLLGLGLLGASLYCARDLLDLHRHGVATNGTIIDARTVHEINYSSRHGVDSNTEHTALIEFTPEGGKPVRFNASFWTRQTIGNEVKVLYDRADPGHAEVDTWSNWLLPGILALIGGYCVLYALGMASGDGIESDRQWTLFRWFD